MVKIVFTKHARVRIEERNVSEIAVKKAIIKPDYQKIDKEDSTKITYYKKVKSGLFLKVVGITEDTKIRVVTSFFIHEKRI